MSTVCDVLLVDLNNFARYPTLPVGYLAAILRRAGRRVGVFAPLAFGVGGVERERPLHPLSLPLAKINYRIATASSALVRDAREWLATRRRSGLTARTATVIAAFTAELQRTRPAVVVVSTYLMYRELCVGLCAACARSGIPVLVGGPYFAQADVIRDWLRIDGLTALAAGELELQAPAIVDALASRTWPAGLPGLFRRGADGEPDGSIAPPGHDLDAVPFPDYADFPWSSYPNRMVPIATGRGCGWGVCTFCSDVTSTAGRSFRSRSPANVLAEIAHHHAEYGVKLFVFTDLKLNSSPAMWRAIAEGMQRAAPGAQWIASVHAGIHIEAALSPRELQAAAASGCVRLTTGLETGSQRVADIMRKGTSVQAISRYLHDATAAGISCRCTMIMGYPGETAEDLELSAGFLDRHSRVIERVSLSRLQIIAGTSLDESLQRKPAQYPGVRRLGTDPGQALVDHGYDEVRKPAHRTAALRLLTAVHGINSRPLSMRARAFEGAM